MGGMNPTILAAAHPGMRTILTWVHPCRVDRDAGHRRSWRRSRHRGIAPHARGVHDGLDRNSRCLCAKTPDDNLCDILHRADEITHCT